MNHAVNPEIATKYHFLIKGFVHSLKITTKMLNSAK